MKIEDQINDVTSGNEVKLKGKIEITMQPNKVFTVGELCVKGMIQVMRPNIIIDGSDAEIEANIDDSRTSNWKSMIR